MKLTDKVLQQTYPETNKLKISDFTTYLCDQIANRDPELIIPHYELPVSSDKLQPNIDKIRDIDINPPIVHNYNEFAL